MEGGDVLGDDDAVVDEDSDHDDQAEHGQEIEGDAHGAHHRECSEDGDNDAGRHPEGDADIQQQDKRQKDEEPAPRGVAAEQFQSPDDEPGKVRREHQRPRRGGGRREAQLPGLMAARDRRYISRAAQVEADALREGRHERLAPATRGIRLGHLGDFNGVVVAHLEDGERRRGLAVEAQPLIDIDELGDDPGDVGQSHDLPGGVRLHDDVADILHAFIGGERAQGDGGCRGSHRTAWQFHHRITDASGEHGKTEIVREEIVGIGLDGDLALTHAPGGDLAHPGEGLEIIAHLADGVLENLFVGVAVEDEIDGGQIRLELADDDPLGLVGQVLKRVDFALDIGDGGVDGHTLKKLDADRTNTL